MPVNTYHLRSSVKGKEPTAGTSAGQLPIGSIAINYHQDEPFLSIQDGAGVVRRIAGVKIDATAPTSPTAGEWWVDTSGTDKLVKVFDGTGWVSAGVPVVDATTAAKGVVRLADGAAVTAGTAGRAVTADQLKTTNDAVTANATNITTVQGQITTIQGQVADASTTAKGIVQLADAAAVTAGTAGLVVTADQLKATNDAVATAVGGGVTTINGTAPISVTGTGNTRTVAVGDASETAKGAVELATVAEAEAGTSTTLVVTPAGLKAGIVKISGGASGTAPTGPTTGQIWTDTSQSPPVVNVWDGTKWVAVGGTPADASDTVKGIVELATDAEVATGTDTARAVTPAGAASHYLAKNIALLTALP